MSDSICFAKPDLPPVQIVDLRDARLQPEGWATERAPPNKNYRHPADMCVYELHIRDFSISDPEVQPITPQGKLPTARFSQLASLTGHWRLFMWA